LLKIEKGYIIGELDIYTSFIPQIIWKKHIVDGKVKLTVDRMDRERNNLDF
jgi:hypothetical protein